MLKKTSWLFAGSLCLTAGLATAADPARSSQTFTPPQASAAPAGTRPAGGQGMQRPTFADFDRNADGRISEQEFDATRSERIAQRASEGRPMRGLAGAPSFAEIDRDGDGSISRAEFAAHRLAGQKGRGPGQGMGPGSGTQ
ncbi:MAG: EF-hand domain-containing protein [Candidatus Accumulibacter sp.]|nr:EF-hand domain-containing protein [Candidatus Accumulibacter necessarius]